VLEFSRRNPLSLVPVELRGLMEEARPGFQQQVRDGVSVRLEPGIGPAWVAADAPLLRQALTNLVRNASDAMAQGGEVTVRLTDRRPPAAREGAGVWVSVEVADQGHGMPREVLERLFEPYFTTKPRGLGTGLGLAQAFGIVREHQGELWVQSPPDGGALVCLSLPVLAQGRPESAPAQQAPAAHPVRGAAPSVLLAEDDVAVRSMLRQWLLQRGCAVVEAASGEEALALLRGGEAPGVLLTDIAMPGMDGAELAREASAMRPGLRVIVLTGYQLEPESIGVEGVTVLRKPPDLG
jgi:CheY-like chemotaxis protein